MKKINNDFEYEGTRRISYDGGAVFIPVCDKCGRYVAADSRVKISESWDAPGPVGENAMCKKCGRTTMIFEGFYANEKD